MIQLFNDECLHKLDELLKNNIKVNSIICDIPYGTTSCAWDEVIPLNDMWSLLNQIVDANAPIVLFSSQPFTSKLIVSNIDNYREELIWIKNKSASGLAAKQKHLKVHENIIVFSNSSKYTYNPQKWYVDEDFVIKRKTLEIAEETNRITNTKKTGRIRQVDDGSRQPISCIAYKVPYSPKKNSKTKNGDYRVHPTQKPLLLMEYLVKTFSNENDTVLDFTMGSGTTGIACKKLNRNFIGIERDKEYFEIARERIENVSTSD